MYFVNFLKNVINVTGKTYSQIRGVTIDSDIRTITISLEIYDNQV